jgi:2-succinyl-5-enolpyruvyl-6-hydroxy-3-cyclohexene-1-carboxylate synthase
LKLHEFFTQNSNITEPGLIWEIASQLPEDWNLFLANSMPIRDANQFFSPMLHQGSIFGNRGVSGIDGNLATACGLAKGNEKPTFAIVGDLTILHDLNSLALVAKSEVPIVICVVNNRGGGIFSFLPVSKRREAFEEFIAASHEIHLEAAAKLFDLPYFHPKTRAEFADLIKSQKQSSCSCVIEITTDRVENVHIHEQIIQAIAPCLNSADLPLEIPTTLH